MRTKPLSGETFACAILAITESQKYFGNAHIANF